MDLKKVQVTLSKKNFYLKIFVFLFSVVLLAINYNLFLVPNHFVIGGTSGLAIIFKQLFGLDTAIFIGVSGIFLMILAIRFLGWKDTSRAIIGAILYPLFISLTAPLANKILTILEIESTLLLALIGGSLCGVANGLLYKTGFTTGGSDILMKIVNKYGKLPEGKAVFSINSIIMLFAGIIFGAKQFIYSLIVLWINTTIIDRILVGISSSKLFFIYTKEEEKIKSFLIHDLKTGVTLLNAKGGFTKEENHVLMCVVPNKNYYLFKEKVLEFDPDAFFVINDCYEVTGGMGRKNMIDAFRMD